jgi:hypothetical protein
MILVKYEDVDITDKVDIRAGIYVDNAGGCADNLIMKFNNTFGNWDKWKPQKGDKIEVFKDSLSSGTMYIDMLSKKDGILILEALSTPPSIKHKTNKTWENIRLYQIIESLKKPSALTFEPHDITNHFYNFFNQVNESELNALNRMCIREGYLLKIFNKKIIIYDEVKAEQAASIREFTSDNMKYEFKTVGEDIYSTCYISNMTDDGELISNTFTPGIPLKGSGEVLNISETLFNYAEAERFAKNLLRFKNKFEICGVIKTDFNSLVFGGNTINVTGTGMYDAKYFVHSVSHELHTNKMIVNVRGCLEGY